MCPLRPTTTLCVDRPITTNGSARGKRLQRSASPTVPPKNEIFVECNWAAGTKIGIICWFSVKKLHTWTHEQQFLGNCLSESSAPNCPKGKDARTAHAHQLTNFLADRYDRIKWHNGPVHEKEIKKKVVPISTHNAERWTYRLQRNGTSLG